MTYRFPDLANKIATVIAIVLVVIAMDGRWFIGTPARAEPIVSPSTYPPRKPKSEVEKPGTATSSTTSPSSGTATSSGAATSSGTAAASGTATGSGTGPSSGTAAASGTATGSGTGPSSGTAPPSGASTASGSKPSSGTSTAAGPSGQSSPVLGNGLADDAGCIARGGKRALTGTLDLNTATVEQLTMLPGIGPAKAERIVSWRRKHGPFRRTADIRRVSGFGFKTFKRLEAYLAITGPTTLAGG